MKKDSTSGVDYYVSAGLSISNFSDSSLSLKNATYPSVEFGVMKNNFSLGLVVGRGNFVKTDGLDSPSDYWTEVKAAVYVPVGNFNAYGLIGVGSYFKSNKVFIEYGAGFAYSFNKLGVFAQASNWDGVFYITPGISYTF